MSNKPTLPPANSIGECLKSPPNTPVPRLTAIIVKVNKPSAFTTKDGRPGTRVVTRIQDPTGEISFVFFNPPKIPEVNDLIEIVQGYVKPPYQPGGSLEIGLSQYPKDGINPEVRILGKGTPPAQQPVQQPIPQQQQIPAWANPVPVQQPAPQPVVQMPNWATNPAYAMPPGQPPVQQSMPPVQTPVAQPVQQTMPPVPASEPVNNGQYPDEDSMGKPDEIAALMLISENLIMLGNKMDEGFKMLNSSLTAIYSELTTAGIDIESKFDEIYKRLIKNGVKAEEIFSALAKSASEAQGLIDHKTAIGVLATEKGIDISDIIGSK